MRQHRLGLGIADAIGQFRQRLETVDGDVMTRRDLRSQAQLPERIELAMPEGDDVGQHALARHCEELLRRSNPVFLCGSGLLRGARNDGEGVTPRRVRSSPLPRKYRSTPSFPW